MPPARMVETSLRPNAENLDDLDKARHFHGFDDLKAARIAFHQILRGRHRRARTAAQARADSGVSNLRVPDGR